MEPRLYSYSRFSTPEQAHGDSLRRQTEAAKRYAQKTGLAFDESLNIKDPGLSGYKGTNIEKGELGKFIIAIEAGRIPKGSVLLIEDADRLSRMEPMEAIALMRRIVNAGVKVITTSDGMEYSTESFAQNQMALLTFVLKAQLAHDESRKKATRIKESWIGRREAIESGDSKCLTKRCPAWLAFDEAEGRFVPIARREEVLQEIFRESADGVGQTLIARRLNERGEPVWGGGNGWHSSYIQKLLNNRSVIGELQPHKMINGKRTPTGDAIPKYFPVVISPKLFKKVQTRRAADASYKGKRPESAGNLFTRIAFSGYTGASVIFLNKGKGRKGGTYLVSDNARRGLGEKYASWSYPKFEDSFLSLITELDFNQIFQENTTNAELEAAKAKLANVQIEKERLEAVVKRLLDLSEKVGSDMEDVSERLLSRKQELSASREQEKDLKGQIEALESVAKSFVAGGKTLQRLFTEKDNPEIRFRLRTAIQDQIERIDVFFYGFDVDSDWFREKVKAAGDYDMLLERFRRYPAAVFQTHESRNELMSYCTRTIADLAEIHCKAKAKREVFIADCIRRDFGGHYSSPFYVVTFKNGAKRYVEFDAKNPKSAIVAQWGGDMVELYTVTKAA
jgi:DNA invertase Pin-like site-specific DNA recombinase